MAYRLLAKMSVVGMIAGVALSIHLIFHAPVAAAIAVAVLATFLFVGGAPRPNQHHPLHRGMKSPKAH